MFANDLHSSIITLHIAVRKRVSPLQDDVYTDKQRRDGEPGTVSDLMKYNAIFLRTPFLILPTLVIVLCWRHQTSGSSVYSSLPHTRTSSFLVISFLPSRNAQELVISFSQGQVQFKPPENERIRVI
jgi:hypothetical protein